MMSKESGNPSFNHSRQSIPNHVDIYVICAKEDAKYCELFCKLLISQDQSLIIKKSLEESNSSRLAYLETSSLVIPLLSPSFLSCEELLHELNIAWCRQRYAEELCFLSIIVDYLPIKPTYTHLLPCFFHCKDKHWERSSEIGPWEDLITEVNVSKEVINCFLYATKSVISSITCSECSIWGLHNKFSNCLHFKNCLQ